MRRILSTRSEPNQHIHAVSLRIRRENPAKEPFDNLVPMGLFLRSRRQADRFNSGLIADSPRQALPQGYGGAEYVCGPRLKRIDNQPKSFEFPLTFGTCGQMGFEGGPFVGTQCMERIEKSRV